MSTPLLRIVSSRSLSRTRWAQIADEGWDAFFIGVLCLGSKSKQTVGRNFLSVDGSQVLLQTDLCFSLAALKAGFATTHEACQVLSPAFFEVPHLETPRRSPSEDDTATELTGREFADLCKACFCNVSNVRARKENLYFFRKEKDGV